VTCALKPSATTRQQVPMQAMRLPNAHEMIFEFTRKATCKAADNGDDGTNDLLVS
jgi:starvation-inducible DNA-binding protein